MVWLTLGTIIIHVTHYLENEDKIAHYRDFRSIVSPTDT